MSKAERMILEDAIETAIKAERKLIIVQTVADILGVCLAIAVMWIIYLGGA